MSSKSSYTTISRYDKFLLYPDIGNNSFLQKSTVFVAQVYVLAMTLTAWLLNTPVLKWYGSGLILIGITSILLYHNIRRKNLEWIPFAGMILALILTTLAMFSLGGISNSGGLFLAGPALIILSLIFRIKEWTLFIALLYAVSLIITLVLHPGSSLEPILPDLHNIVFFTSNMLLLSGLIVVLALALFNFKAKTEAVLKAGKNQEEQTNIVGAGFFNAFEGSFKQPLEAIHQNATLLKAKNNKGVDKQLIDIWNDSKKALIVLDQLRDLIKTEAKNMPIKKYQSDLIGFARTITNSLNSQALNKKQNLTFSSNILQFNLDFDPHIIHLIISSLISRAIAVCESQSDISIIVNKEKENSFKDLVEIIIDYKAEALKPDMIKLINDEDATAQRFSDKDIISDEITFLLSGKLVRLVGGRIFVRSKIDKGTRFRIHLPVHNAAPFIALNDLAKDIGLELQYTPEQGDHNSKLPSTLSPSTTLHSKPSAT